MFLKEPAGAGQLYSTLQLVTCVLMAFKVGSGSTPAKNNADVFLCSTMLFVDIDL